jgi:hypothetical protein
MQHLALTATGLEVEDDAVGTDDIGEFDHATSVVISSHSGELGAQNVCDQIALVARMALAIPTNL